MKTIYKLPITLVTITILVAYFKVDPSYFDGGAFHKGAVLSVCMVLWTALTNYTLYFQTPKFLPIFYWTVGTAILIVTSVLF